MGDAGGDPEEGASSHGVTPCRPIAADLVESLQAALVRALTVTLGLRGVPIPGRTRRDDGACGCGVMAGVQRSVCLIGDLIDGIGAGNAARYRARVTEI